jgi:protein-L-isoaspartate(D-aspartate) O-methyltransferase
MDTDEDGERRFDRLMAERRDRMVREQIERRGIRDERVLAAMRAIERHLFVPEVYVDSAYGDYPLPIGSEQTLSQPYIVALMTEALGLEGGERVLEIGTGSGYQTAVLAELAGQVFTVEIVSELSAKARDRIEALGYDNVSFRVGDGKLGWPEEAPFDGILVAAAPDAVPDALRDQLGLGGRLVIPVGPPLEQELELVQRVSGEESGFRVRSLGAVRFVPLL